MSKKELEKRIRKLELLLLDLASRKDRCIYIYQSDLIEALAKRKIFSAKKIQDERTKKLSKWYTPPVVPSKKGKQKYKKFKFKTRHGSVSFKVRVPKKPKRSTKK